MHDRIQALPIPYQKQRQRGRVPCFVSRRVIGFTLVELLVSMGLFIVIMSVALTIYTATLRAQRLIIASNRVQRDTQIVFDVLTKSIRSSLVDYRPSGYYGGTIPLETSALALIDRDLIPTVFQLNNNAVEVRQGLSASFQPMTSSSVVVQELSFYITPSTNPFSDLSNPPLIQPKITIVLTAAPLGRPDSSITVQQTLPQRSGGY